MAKTPHAEPWERGYIHVYTGNGKGKTTAALGLAVRAAGAGLATFIAQFVKGKQYSELHALAKLSDMITVSQYGRGCFIRTAPTELDIRAARKGLSESSKKLASGDYRLVILDEANIAVNFKLFTVEDLLEAVALKPAGVELVITGRNADPKLIARADLVTEMREVKHYYTHGVTARRGIET